MVPSSFKVAVITPRLKKPGADPNNFANFRPISNLPFLSKILEKVVASPVHYHLLNSTLLSSCILGCLEEIKSWFSRNFLKLNTDKTEVLLVGTKSNLLIQ